MITTTDLKKFTSDIVRGLRRQSHCEVQVVNVKRGYVLYYLPHPDHFCEDPREVAQRQVSMALDGIDCVFWR